MKDYYSILDVPRNADIATITDAYNAMRQTFHPDNFGHSSDSVKAKTASKVFKNVQEAWEALSNQSKRAEYDRELNRFEEERVRATRATHSPSSYNGTDRAADAGHETRPDHTRPRDSDAPRVDVPQWRPAFLSLEMMPKDVRNWIYSRQAQSISAQVRIPLSHPAQCLTGLLLCVGSVSVACAIAALRPLSVSTVSLLGLVCIISFVIAARLLLPYVCRIGCSFYVTPLYLVETGYNQAAYWPLWQLKPGMKMERLKKGSNTYTILHIPLCDFTRSIIIKDPALAERFVVTLNKYIKLIDSALKANELASLVNHDDLRTLDGRTNPSVLPPQPRFLLQSFSTGGFIGSLLALGIVLCTLPAGSMSGASNDLSPDTNNSAGELFSSVDRAQYEASAEPASARKLAWKPLSSPRTSDNTARSSPSRVLPAPDFRNEFSSAQFLPVISDETESREVLVKAARTHFSSPLYRYDDARYADLTGRPMFAPGAFSIVEVAHDGSLLMFSTTKGWLISFPPRDDGYGRIEAQAQAYGKESSIRREWQSRIEIASSGNDGNDASLQPLWASTLQNPRADNLGRFPSPLDEGVSARETFYRMPQWGDYSGAARGSVTLISHKDGAIFCTASFLRSTSSSRIKFVPVFRRSSEPRTVPMFVGEIDNLKAHGNSLSGRCVGFVPLEGDIVILSLE